LKSIRPKQFSEFLRSLAKKPFKSYEFISLELQNIGKNCILQIDILGKVRAGKIILRQGNGHRIKKLYHHINWVHKL
jgi:hypothetical protein